MELLCCVERVLKAEGFGGKKDTMRVTPCLCGLFDVGEKREQPKNVVRL